MGWYRGKLPLAPKERFFGREVFSFWPGAHGRRYLKNAGARLVAARVRKPLWDGKNIRANKERLVAARGKPLWDAEKIHAKKGVCYRARKKTMSKGQGTVPCLLNKRRESSDGEVLCDDTYLLSQ